VKMSVRLIVAPLDISPTPWGDGARKLETAS
jgi:hypothetical protein